MIARHVRRWRQRAARLVFSVAIVSAVPIHEYVLAA
jgi:hypothetical protein